MIVITHCSISPQIHTSIQAHTHSHMQPLHHKEDADAAPQVKTPVTDVIHNAMQTHKPTHTHTYSRYDYEEVATDAANKVMAQVTDVISKSPKGTKMGTFTLGKAKSSVFNVPSASRHAACVCTWNA